MNFLTNLPVTILAIAFLVSDSISPSFAQKSSLSIANQQINLLSLMAQMSPKDASIFKDINNNVYKPEILAAV
jgi:hypothetical protein